MAIQFKKIYYRQQYIKNKWYLTIYILLINEMKLKTSISKLYQ